MTFVDFLFPMVGFGFVWGGCGFSPCHLPEQYRVVTPPFANPYMLSTSSTLCSSPVMYLRGLLMIYQKEIAKISVPKKCFPKFHLPNKDLPILFFPKKIYANVLFSLRMLRQ
jgi:hypothetical protein